MRVAIVERDEKVLEELKKGLIAIAESYNYVSDGEFEIRKN